MSFWIAHEYSEMKIFQKLQNKPIKAILWLELVERGYQIGNTKIHKRGDSPVFEIDNWNFHQMLDLGFSDTSNFSSFKAELLQLNCTQFPSLGFFVSKKVGNQKN